MFWAEVNDLTGWLCSYNINRDTPLQYVVIKRKATMLDHWLGYFPQDNQIDAMKFAGVDINNNLMLYVYSRNELTPIRYVKDYLLKLESKLSWQEPTSKSLSIIKEAAPESYTSGSDVDQLKFLDLTENHIEDKDLSFSKDEFIGEDEAPLKFVLDPNSKGYQHFDDFPSQAYDGVKSSLNQLSWQEPREKYKEVFEWLDNIMKDYFPIKNKFDIIPLYVGKEIRNNFIFSNPEIDEIVYLWKQEQIFKNNQKLSFELPKAEEVTQYDISPLTEMNLYPSKRKDNYDYKKRNTKGDEEMLFEKGLHQSIDRPETNRDLTPYGSKLSWRVFKEEEYIEEDKKRSNQDIINILKATSGDGWKYYLEDPAYIIKGNIKIYVFNDVLITILVNHIDDEESEDNLDSSSADTVDEAVQLIHEYKQQYSRSTFAWQEIDPPSTSLIGWLVLYKPYFDASENTWKYGVVTRQEDYRLFGRWADTKEKAIHNYFKKAGLSYNVVSFHLGEGHKYIVIPLQKIIKTSSQNQLFMYVKPGDKIPLQIDEVHTTVVYLKNSIEGKDRQKVIEDISNLLKDYKKPLCQFNGVATFDNEDKSRVILINFENGAELYSDLINILSEYVDIERDYNFIPHMTIDKNLSIDKLPEYNWKPDVLYIEFEKGVPAIEIEFETGKIKEAQNLDETVNEDLEKLGWKDFDKTVENSTYGDIWYAPRDDMYVVINRIDLIPDPFNSEKWINIIGGGYYNFNFIIKEYSLFHTLISRKMTKKIEDVQDYKYIGNIKDIVKNSTHHIETIHTTT